MAAFDDKEFWDDLKWGRQHYPELIKKYADKWVAIVNGKVVAAGDSIKKIEAEAERKTGRPKDKIPVMFIECGAHVYES